MRRYNPKKMMEEMRRFERQILDKTPESLRDDVAVISLYKGLEMAESSLRRLRRYGLGGINNIVAVADYIGQPLEYFLDAPPKNKNKG